MTITLILEFLQGKKTYSAAIIAILSAALAYASGETNLVDSLQIVVPALLSMTLRSGMKPSV
jgi:type IV secretory pathway VirB2 component (pilin)